MSVASSNYWSSSQNVSGAKYAWNVNFKNGNTNNNTRSNENHVRCVRHREYFPPFLEGIKTIMEKIMKKLLILVILNTFIFASQTVMVGNLEWQDDSAVETNKLNWQDAIGYCQALRLSNHSDWYLPSIKELQSIVDVSRYKPAIKSAFKNVASSLYWSSSQTVSDAKDAWYVHFKFGDTSYITKSLEGYVRCVRHRQ